MGNIVLPFRQVSGHLELSGNPGLFRVSIPHLESAGMMTLSNNTDLHVFNCSMPRLGTISVDSNPTARLSLAQLESLGGSSTFSNLTFLDLASLHNATEPGTYLTFSNNTFTELHLPALDVLATGLSIKDNSFLNDANLDRLRRVDGSLAVKGNGRLLAFTANRLVAVKGSVRLAGSFTSVDMFRLEKVAGDFELTGTRRWTVRGSTSTFPEGWSEGGIAAREITHPRLWHGGREPTAGTPLLLKMTKGCQRAPERALALGWGLV